MELFEIRQGIDQYCSKLKQLGESLDLEVKESLIQQLTSAQEKDGFWENYVKHLLQSIKERSSSEFFRAAFL